MFKLARHTPEFFPFITRVLNLVGLWPPQRKIQKTIYVTIHGVLFVMFALTLNLGEIIQCWLTRDDLKATCLNLAVIILHLTASMRIVNWQFIRKDCKKIIGYFEPNIVESVDKTEIWSYHSEETSCSKQSSRSGFKEVKMTTTKRDDCISVVFHLQLLSTIIVVIAACYLRIFMINPIEYNPITNTTTAIPKKLMFNSYFPFHLLENHFIFALIYQMLSTYFLMLQYCPMDCFFIGSLIKLNGQLRLLQKDVKLIDDVNIEEARQRKLTVYVQETKKFLKIAELLEKSHSTPLLMQYGGATLVLCTLIYVLPLVETGSEIFIVTSIFGVQALETLFICWLSENMTSEFLKLAEALYEINWDEMNLEFQKSLIFIAMRFQKPVRLTLGKFFNVNLSFYVNFMKISYSFYTLLQKQRK